MLLSPMPWSLPCLKTPKQGRLITDFFIDLKANPITVQIYQVLYLRAFYWHRLSTALSGPVYTRGNPEQPLSVKEAATLLHAFTQEGELQEVDISAASGRTVLEATPRLFKPLTFSFLPHREPALFGPPGSRYCQSLRQLVVDEGHPTADALSIIWRTIRVEQ